MKRPLFLHALFLLVLVGVFLGRATAQTVPDPYKPVLDRLESFTIQAIPDLRFHADIAHPEDSLLDDSSWQTIKLDEHWYTNPRVFRRSIEIPAKLNGYATQGASVKLDLTFDSDGPIIIGVFSNGGLVYHGDEGSQPIPLTESALPGQRFQIAVRLDARAVDTRISGARLLFEPSRDRPSPILVREEIMAARPIIAAYADGRAERQQQLDAAVKAVDFSPLDHGDQAGFDASLRSAQTKLQLLNPWLKQFTIRAVGNSHIDMAWLWPWTETVEVVRNTFRSVLDLSLAVVSAQTAHPAASSPPSCGRSLPPWPARGHHAGPPASRDCVRPPQSPA